MRRSAGVVLCGGRSSRMGRPKALLPWRGRRMVEHVCAVLGEVVDELVVVGSADLDLPPLDARRVTDREPGLGPLAGIREGLEAITAPRAFVTATDAPFLTPALVRSLLARGDAVAPVVDGHVQTLCAVYPRSLVRTAGELIASGRLRPLSLLEAAEFVRVPAEELPDPSSVRGFNTPAEYLEAIRADDPRARVTVEYGGGRPPRGDFGPGAGGNSVRGPRARGTRPFSGRRARA